MVREIGADCERTIRWKDGCTFVPVSSLVQRFKAAPACIAKLDPVPCMYLCVWTLTPGPLVKGRSLCTALRKKKFSPLYISGTHEPPHAEPGSSLPLACSGTKGGRPCLPCAGAQQCPVQGHSNGATCLQFNPTNAMQLVSGSDDQSVRLWDGLKDGVTDLQSLLIVNKPPLSLSLARSLSLTHSRSLTLSRQCGHAAIHLARQVVRVLQFGLKPNAITRIHVYAETCAAHAASTQAKKIQAFYAGPLSLTN